MGESTRLTDGLLRASIALVILAVAGCGTVGPPVAPEDVGIGPLIERQKKSQAQSPEQGPPPLDSVQSESPELRPVGQDQELPSLRPVSGR